MELSRIEYFVRVAEAGSFLRAAIMLGISQPTLSRQIRLLETDIGQRLLHRTGRGVALTEAGTCFLLHCKKILEEWRVALQHLRQVQAVPAGRVRVGVTASLAKSITPELVHRVLRDLPGCTITVTDGLSAELRERLLDGEVDLAVLYSADQSSKLDWETLSREEMMLVCGPQMRAALPPAVAFAELAKFPLVLPAVPNPIRMLLQSHCRRHKVELSIVAEVNAVESLVAMVSKRDCFSVLPRSRALQAAQQGELFLSRIHSPAVLNRLCLATGADWSESPVTKEVKWILRKMFAASEQLPKR